MEPIRALRLDAALERPAASGTRPAAAASFGSALADALQRVNQTQREAEALARGFQLEDPAVGLEETMVAIAKANVAFQTLVQVRNRLVAAYNDIMNMQV